MSTRSFEPEAMAEQLKSFDADLAGLGKSISEARFEAAEQICSEIQEKAQQIGIVEINSIVEELRNELKHKERWRALHYFANDFRLAFLGEIVPLQFGIQRSDEDKDPSRSTQN